MNRKILEKQLENGKLKVTVSGISMHPTYKRSDVLYVRKIEKAPLIGDVICFFAYNHHVIHRVIAIEGDYVITKGDNNRYADPPVYYKDILGKVIEENENIKVQKQNENIIINVWKPELYNCYEELGKIFGIKVIKRPDVIFKDACNICISRVSTKELKDISKEALNNKVCFHIGVNVSNINGYENVGLTNDEVFDYVVRASIYSLEEITNIRENALVILSYINTLMKH